MFTVTARQVKRHFQLSLSPTASILHLCRSSPASLSDRIKLEGGFLKKVTNHASAFSSFLDEKLLNDVEKDFWNAPLSQVMSDKPREAYILEGDVPVWNAMQQMLTNNVESVHVVASKTPEAPHLGVFNQRDFLHCLVSQRGLELRHQRLKDVVRRQSHDIVCGLYETVKDCVYLMHKHEIHLVPLVLRPNQPLENILLRDCAQILSTSDLRNFLLFHGSLQTLRCLDLLSIGDILQSMNRESRNTDRLVTADARESVAVACKRMIDRKVGCIVTGTLEETNPLQPYPNYHSLLTQKDIIVQYLKNGERTLALPVAEAVSAKPVRVSSPNYTIFQILEMLYEDDSRYSLLFSTDEDDLRDSTSRCLALVSLRDIFIHCLKMFPSR